MDYGQTHERLTVMGRPERAIDTLNALWAEIQAEILGVRRDYPTLDLAARLIARTGTGHFEDAVREEARQRVLRNRWAAVTSKAESQS